MREAHRGSSIGEAEQSAATGDILDTLFRHGHGEASCTEVPGILRSLKEEIIRP